MQRNTFEEIKNIVFARKVGQCLSVEEWQQFYAEGGKDLPVDHLTSCSHCLDIVNNLLGLPALSERHPFDTISRDSGGDGPSSPASPGENSSPAGGKAGAADQTAILQRLEKARSEHFAHQPEEITLCINGWPLSSRRVQEGVNALTVRPQMEEPLESLELLDENSRLLCHLSVGEQCAAGGNGQWLNLSPSPAQRVDFAVTWIDDYPEIYLKYTDQRLASLPAPDQGGFIQKINAWLSALWSPSPALRPAMAALALLLLLSIPATLLYIEFSRGRESIAALQRELETTRQDRDLLTRRLTEEQALRKAAEAERDLLEQRYLNRPEDKVTPQPEQIAEASLSLRLRPGTQDMDTYQIGAIRGGPFIRTIELARSKEASFALSVPRRDEESQTYFDAYLIRVSIPGRQPVLARLKSPSAPPDMPFVVLQAEVANADRLASDTRGEVIVFGIAGKRQIELGRLPFRVQ